MVDRQIVDTNLVASTVSCRIMGIRRRSEKKTTSRHEGATLCRNQENEQKKGKDGGRQRFRYINGDVPHCIRSNDDANTSTKKEKGSSSNNANEGSGSKEEKRKEATHGSKDPSSSSIGKKKTLREADEEIDITFVVLQKNVRSLN